LAGKAGKREKKPGELIIERILLIAALLSVLSVIFITLFIVIEGAPLFQKVGIFEFLFGREWGPTGEPPKFGILPFIMGLIWITLGALTIAVPIGLSVGIFMAEIAKGRIARFLRSIIELLAGIPSVIYGLFGYIAIAPIIRGTTSSNTGLGILTASIVLAIMVLPTIVNITEVSIRAVPREFKEGSLALGATHWQTIYKTLIPAAKSGIIAGIILGMGRAIGETMAVLMVAGNSIQMPKGVLSHARTLTMNIATDMKYAAGDHWTSLFTTGIVLFFFILALNLVVQALLKRSLTKAEG
jgi:phosphate transport system permease protein